jgi:hypothetical protein
MQRAVTATCLFTFFCLVSTSVLGAQTFKEYEVEFKAHPQKGELRAVTNGQGCTRGQGNEQKKKGCVKFEENDFGLITFSLGNQLRTCTDESTKWVISKVELSDKGYKLDGGAISNKGIFEEQPALGDWMKAAFPQLDEDTGVLYEADPPKNGSTRVTSLNLNNNASDDPKDIWYRVSIASCEADSDVVLVTDPRFENDGSTN